MGVKPAAKPKRPQFSSGPCAKRPGWSPDVLRGALLGRSHRSAAGRARLLDAITRTRDLLRLPDGYQVAIVPGSDTGAFEMALWNLIGPRGADVFAWDVFGRIWLKDILDELRLKDVRTFTADWGRLPDLGQADFSRDVIFTWNGTTTGVTVPNADWIDRDRQGLVFVDATSAIFAEPIDLSKIDVLTFSWQKVLGGEAAHGMLVLSPQALERLAAYTPPWPIPKVFRLKADGEILGDVFKGVTINTPSMLCVEDYLDALAWMTSTGGLDGAIARARTNSSIIYRWIEASRWARPLARDPATRSHTSVCLTISDATGLGGNTQAAEAIVGQMAAMLAAEGVAFDIASYRGMPPGLRIWTGATVDADDITALLPWLDWAFEASSAAPG
jgi:phosphoserine aminotransferase